jgi:hypothetical protein
VATAVASIDAFISVPVLMSRPPAVIEEEDTDEPEPVAEPSARGGRNLAAAILLLAIQDYQFGSPHDHDSAASFLYPEIPATKAHLEAICNLMSGLAIGTLREALDRMRPHWDVARQQWNGR